MMMFPLSIAFLVEFEFLLKYLIFREVWIFD